MEAILKDRFEKTILKSNFREIGFYAWNNKDPVSRQVLLRNPRALKVYNLVSYGKNASVGPHPQMHFCRKSAGYFSLECLKSVWNFAG